MVLILYRLLCLLIVGVIVWNMFRTDKNQEKVVYSFLIIPLLLRAFLIK